MKYINVGIDEELHKRIKIESAQRGISITKYVTDCLGSRGSTKGDTEKKPQKSRMEKVRDDMYPELVETPKEDKDNISLGIVNLNPAPKPKKGKK